MELSTKGNPHTILLEESRTKQRDQKTHFWNPLFFTRLYLKWTRICLWFECSFGWLWSGLQQ